MRILRWNDVLLFNFTFFFYVVINFNMTPLKSFKLFLTLPLLDKYFDLSYFYMESAKWHVYVLACLVCFKFLRAL